MQCRKRSIREKLIEDKAFGEDRNKSGIDQNRGAVQYFPAPLALHFNFRSDRHRSELDLDFKSNAPKELEPKPDGKSITDNKIWIDDYFKK